MPDDNTLWLPPLSPKSQKWLSNYRKSLNRKILKQLFRPAIWFARWISFTGKSFWDILGIVVVPIAIVVATMQFSAQQSETSARIAKDQQQESILKDYLSQMSDLLLNSNLSKSNPGDGVRHVARSHTLFALKQLNGKRKGDLIRFMYEAGIIHQEGAIVNLNGADISHVDLHGTDLHGINLSGANQRRKPVGFQPK